jgi:hypothetical protein
VTVAHCGDEMSHESENGARRRSSRRGGMGQEMAEEGGPALRAKVRQLAAFVRESKHGVVCVIVTLSFTSVWCRIM